MEVLVVWPALSATHTVPVQDDDGPQNSGRRSNINIMPHSTPNLPYLLDVVPKECSNLVMQLQNHENTRQPKGNPPMVSHLEHLAAADPEVAAFPAGSADAVSHIHPSRSLPIQSLYRVFPAEKVYSAKAMIKDHLHRCSSPTNVGIRAPVQDSKRQ